MAFQLSRSRGWHIRIDEVKLRRQLVEFVNIERPDPVGFIEAGGGDEVEAHAT